MSDRASYTCMRLQKEAMEGQVHVNLGHRRYFAITGTSPGQGLVSHTDEIIRGQGYIGSGGREGLETLNRFLLAMPESGRS